jgi:hypothetical protein
MMSSLIIFILITIALVGCCVLALSISIIVKKNGKFPETEVGKNQNMRKLGIRCTKQEEIIRWRQMKGETVNPEELCCGCSGDKCTLEE